MKICTFFRATLPVFNSTRQNVLMNRFSKYTVYCRPVVAEKCDMRFLKIDLETKLNVVANYFFTEYITFVLVFQSIDCWYALKSPQ